MDYSSTPLMPSLKLVLSAEQFKKKYVWQFTEHTEITFKLTSADQYPHCNEMWTDHVTCVAVTHTNLVSS